MSDISQVENNAIDGEDEMGSWNAFPNGVWEQENEKIFYFA
jgi:hypothetical protein